MPAPPDTLTTTLRQARRASRLSQLELSMRVGVSQRHVSYVESGRAKPSRELLRAWLRELNAPLVVRNEAMLLAGFAPVYGDSPLGDPALAQHDEALSHLLSAHDPMPAFLMDANWNLLRTNRGGRWLGAVLVPGLAERPDSRPLNMLDALCDPEGFTRQLLNLGEVGPVLLARLRGEAAAQPALKPQVEAFAALLRSRLGNAEWQSGMPRMAPVLTSRFATAAGELAFFSMFTTFGTPQDITLASLRVEHLCAADEATREVLRAQVT